MTYQPIRKGFVIETNIRGCECHNKPPFVVIPSNHFSYFDWATEEAPLTSDLGMEGYCDRCDADVIYDRHFVVTSDDNDKQLQLPLNMCWASEIVRISNLTEP